MCLMPSNEALHIEVDWSAVIEKECWYRSRAGALCYERNILDSLQRRRAFNQAAFRRSTHWVISRVVTWEHTEIS
eukprot:scaffold277442_cov18-Prasinocladus_malaysianus.AAC.1